MTNSLVTIVVCTYNDEQTIGAVLRGLTSLTYRPLEIVAINDASTDATGNIIRQFEPAVRCIDNPSNRGLGYNQNLGLSLAHGEYLALVQSDCEVTDPAWLGEMMEEMQPGVGAVVSQRRIEDFRSLPPGARLFNAVAPQDLTNGSGKARELLYFRGKADLYRTSVLRELGGWDAGFFTAGEDTDLSIRLRARGHSIVLHPRASVRYLFSGRQVSIAGGLRKAFLYGRTAALLYRLHRYDGIQSRTYMTLLLATVALCLPAPAAEAAAGLGLLLYAMTCRIQTASGRSIPFGLMALVAAIPLAVLDLPVALPGLLSLPARALVVAGSIYLSYLAAKNTARNVGKGEKLSSVPGTFAFCLAWRLISGIGYLAGWLQSVRRVRAGNVKAGTEARRRTEIANIKNESPAD